MHMECQMVRQNLSSKQNWVHFQKGSYQGNWWEIFEHEANIVS